MKIQRGIVKYKDRNDIVCTYALTDDGKQYYFLDETDTKKFSNGNRIASTALVEAIDPMAKAVNVGVIDQNGVVVVPFENRSIRPVNDNVIVIEKAVPTSQSVIDANELRSDSASAATLVSTAATIKDKLNAQMGVEGKYIFNDQFSEATICDINGTNLVGGEQYSFISMANDKLYMSKNTADSPIAEFSLTTYELTTAPQAIDVAAAGVDPQVVEGALNSQGSVDVQNAVVPVDGVVNPADAVVPVDGAVAPTDTVVDAPVDGAVAPTDTVVDAPVDGAVAPTDTVVDVPVDGAVAVPGNVNVVTPSDVAAATEGITLATPVEGGNPNEEMVMDFDDDAYAAKQLVKEPNEALTNPNEEMVMAFDDDAYAAKKNAIEENPVTDASTIPYDNSVNTVDFPTNLPTDNSPSEFSATDTSISDDLKAFANGTPAEDEVAPNTNDVVVAPVNGTDDVVEALPEEEDDDIPPIVEEEDKGAEDTTPTEEKVVDGADKIAPIVDDKLDSNTEEHVDDETSVSDHTDTSEDVNDFVEQIFSDTVKSLPEEDDDDKEDEVPFNKPVNIDAETVLATVDKNNNGIIDSDEIMVPQTKKVEPVKEVQMPSTTPTTTSSSLTDIFGTSREDVTRDYGYSTPTSYSTSYTTPSYSSDYSSIFTEVKPDRIGYDSYSSGGDNIVADVAQFMQELVKQNKDQKAIIGQYQQKVENLESQARLLADKFKDQSIRYESLSGKLRSLDEATGRLESRNQMLEGRVREQESVIAAQDRELKTLRPQVEGRQDLVRLLADARNLLGSDNSYGYNDGDSYYGRRVA